MKSQAGMSIVEILIAAFILGVLSTAALNFYQNQHSQYMQQTDASDVQQNIRVVMQELTRQIRLAGYGAFGMEACQIPAAGDSLLVRYADAGVVHEQRYYVRRDTTGRNLMTQLDAGLPQVFAENIDSVRFTGGGAGAGIQWITVEIVAKSDREGFYTSSASATDKHLYRRLSSTVRLRNR
jgi:type II secretory pathway pseudopilin PulG